MDESLTWKIIDSYFQDKPDFLTKHHLSSYNQFMLEELPAIIKSNNPITYVEQPDKIPFKALIYIGGKNNDKIVYGKPTIYDEDRIDKMHYMYPNEARLRNMTYGVTIHVDIDIDVTYTDNLRVEPITLKNVLFGRFPIMLQSKLCILNGMEPMVRFNMGECVSDPGGYFIIDGKEKVIISQEKFASNMPNIKKVDSDKWSTLIEMKSISEDASKPVRKLSLGVLKETATFTNNQIVVNLPNVKREIPLFVVMRALGVVSDKNIIEHCLLDLKANPSMVELFLPSVHDAGAIFSQETAVKYIASFVKGETVFAAMNILCNYLLPHVGTTNYIEKAFYLGYMVNQLLKVHVGIDRPTDRDSFKFKRVELSGNLLSSLFQEYYKLYINTITKNLYTLYYHNKPTYNGEKFKDLFTKPIFEERVVETGFRKAFKGDWGVESYTKRVGLVQDLKRLSFNATVAHLRMINLPFDTSAKITGPRLLHSSQWGMIDPIDTPDGENVGLHKNLAIATSISEGYSKVKLVEFICTLKKGEDLLIVEVTKCHPCELFKMVRVFVNGGWHGSTKFPVELVEQLRYFRRISMIPFSTSISWNISEKNIYIFTDAGRLMRPIFFLEKGKLNMDAMNDPDVSWQRLTRGSMVLPDYDQRRVYNHIEELYPGKGSIEKPAIEYIDTAESENCMITFEDVGVEYTHREIHASFLLGVMGNQVVFPENNQLPRDLFSCGQGKQAVSMYSTNYQNRIDTMGVILNYGQIPLIKSRYLKYINNEKNPYGVNTIVAIMCYSGYNVEDSIIFNQSAIDRGLFNTSYFSSYETREESNPANDSSIEIMNVLNNEVTGRKQGYDYNNLDKDGLIRENTKVNDEMIMIGKANVYNKEKADGKLMVDDSVTASKGQTGYVDKAFITQGDEGTRIAKIRVREERMPEIGDKFVSRVGQKGTCGVILKEVDMPYTANGMRPDIIINPHALPSRMTIGQLLEMLMGKVHLQCGAYGDCTAFNNKGLKAETYGDLLNNMKYHKSGNEVLYNGMTGEQIESDIFIGPTYYLRLKHMVKDKINYRRTGVNTLLTRQVVQGRSNDGGLRIGEMERDGLLANGMTKFVQDSFLKRGDEYLMAVDNASGMIAVYNPQKNLFLSPVIDGPLKYVKSIDDEAESMNIINVSKHGKTFSVLKLPYAFKLLIQELAVMNVQMRVITDDNVDHLTSMSFSDNISKLMNEPNEHITDVVQHIIEQNEKIDRPKLQKIQVVPEKKKKKFKVNDMVAVVNDSRVWEIQSLKGTKASLKHNNEVEEVDVKDLDLSSLQKIDTRFNVGDVVSYQGDVHYYIIDLIKPNNTVVIRRNNTKEVPLDFLVPVMLGFEKVIRESDKRIGTFFDKHSLETESDKRTDPINVVISVFYDDRGDGYDDDGYSNETIKTIIKYAMNEPLHVDATSPIVTSTENVPVQASTVPVAPALSPVYSPTLSPVYSPTLSPVYSPTLPPVYSPTLPPVYSPTSSPVYSPTTGGSNGSNVDVKIHLGAFPESKEEALTSSLPNLSNQDTLKKIVAVNETKKVII